MQIKQEVLVVNIVFNDTKVQWLETNIKVLWRTLFPYSLQVLSYFHSSTTRDEERQAWCPTSILDQEKCRAKMYSIKGWVSLTQNLWDV